MKRIYVFSLVFQQPAKDKSLPQALILDPGLYLSVGHHLDYDKSMANALAQFGYSAKIFCNRNVWDPFILNAAHGSFTYNLYGKIPRTELDDRLAIHIRELHQVCSPCMSTDGLAFFPNAGLLDILALRKAPELVKSFKSIHLILRYWEIDKALGDGEDSTPLFEESLKFLSTCYDHIYLYTDTHALKSMWKQLGISVQLVPLPIDPDLSYHQSSSKKEYEILSLGQTSPEKGLTLIVNTLLTLASHNIYPKGFVQSTFFEFSPDIREKLPNITFNNTPLSRDAYNNLLLNSRFYMNLYDPTRFRYGSSHALLESVIAGCIPICTDYPFARAILGPMFGRLSVSLSIGNVIDQLVNLYREQDSSEPINLSSELQKTARNLREIHSPKQLVECLLLNS